MLVTLQYISSPTVAMHNAYAFESYLKYVILILLPSAPLSFFVGGVTAFFMAFFDINPEGTSPIFSGKIPWEEITTLNFFSFLLGYLQWFCLAPKAVKLFKFILR